MDSPTGCAYCGLPVPASWWGKRLAAEDGRAGPAEPAFCCYGCRFAAEVSRSKDEGNSASARALARLLLAVFCSMNVMVFTMALWPQDFYGTPGDAHGSMTILQDLFRYLSMLFVLPVLYLLGGPLLENARFMLRRGHWSTDLLLLLGVAASFAYSSYSVFAEEGKIYFEVGCVVMLLVTLGRWLEAAGKQRTNAALESLQKLLPEKVRFVDQQGERLVPLADVAVGAVIRVLPGERIGCDGVLLRQPASVDEQILTGESGGTVKEPGDLVHAGTLNLESELLAEVTAPAGSGALDRLIDQMRQARLARGHYEQLADRVSAWFLPAVVIISMGTFLVHAWWDSLGQGILASLAVLVIACPCALGLATPMAVWAALGQAARAQVLFQSGEVLERLAGIRAVCLDKTGTITTGASKVTDMAIADGEARQETLAKAASLAGGSLHSLSISLSRYAQEKMVGRVSRPVRTGLETRPTGVRTLPGRGLIAESDGASICLGNLRLMREQDLGMPNDLALVVAAALDRAQPLVGLGWSGKVRAIFVFQEELRPEVKEAISSLRSMGLHLQILTGDHERRGQAVANELGIPVQAELLPDDKAAAVQAVRSQFGPVAMVGDGINDAPALVRCDVGIAMGCGADFTRASAGVCLLGNDLRRLPWTIALARQTVRIIRQNLFWAFVYNTAGIALACTGRLNPVVAALAMVVSSLMVVGNSLRLKGTNPS